MEFSKLKKDSPFSVYLSIAEIHKTELPESILSNLSIKRLATLYKLLCELNYLNIYVAIRNKEIIGSLSLNAELKLSKFFKFRSLYIFYLIIACYIRKPFSSMFLSYCKFKVYKNIKFDINLPFLFIKKELQGNNIGSQLLNFVLNQIEGVISVDTYAKNTSAINFYKQNGFSLIQSYKTITVLLKT
jgi:GNAT superfamily N-acetyltransferase